MKQETDSPEPGSVDQRQEAAVQFVAAFEQALTGSGFSHVVLSRNRGADKDLRRIEARLVEIQGRRQLSLLLRYKTRDITRNMPVHEGICFVKEHLCTTFQSGHLFLDGEQVEMLVSRKGKARLNRRKGAGRAPPSLEHNRSKVRLVDADRPFLCELGVTDARGSVLPSMSDKFKQINQFLAIFAKALERSGLSAAQTVRVLDFGAGKGYLTFAIHHHLSSTLGLSCEVIGIELREELVRLCNDAARRLSLEGLRMEAGDLRAAPDARMDVLVALHACDTATDEAIYLGIKGGASVLLVSPCCHKELRPQMVVPEPLEPLLRFGVHAAQEAEMLTDSMRALQLESQGYVVQIVEFVSGEHTDKNKMLVATRARVTDAKKRAALERLQVLKNFYGISHQRLEELLDPGQ